MKKVLIIANLYHASPRIPGVSTYLPEFEWKATIITPPLGNNVETLLGLPKKFMERVKINTAPYRGDIYWFWRKLFKLIGFKMNESITEQVKERVGIVSKRSVVDLLLKWHQTIFAYPDTERTWERPAFRVASELLRKECFDAILSSSPFPTTHIVASKIKRKFGLPWLADFRDTWTENPVYPFPNFRKAIDRILEKNTLKYADAFVTVSFPYAHDIALLTKKNVNIVTNGFDPDNIGGTPCSLTRKFTITYTGTIYTDKQDPEKFFIALRNLMEKKLINPEDVEIRLYGKRLSWLKNVIDKYEFSSMAKQYGTIPRKEVLERQKDSQILLFFNWEDPVKKGLSHLKFFEYLSVQRPILACGGFPKDDVEKILIQTRAGTYAPTIKEIQKGLLGFYEEYEHTGKVSYNGYLEEINKYSYREMAKKFADILNQISNR